MNSGQMRRLVRPLRWGSMVLLMALGFGAATQVARGQAVGYQTLASPAGYQFAVPSAWQLGSAQGAAGTLAASPDGSELAYVSLVQSPPAGSDTNESSNEVLQGITDGAIGRRSTESNYQVTQAAAATTVPGADAAEMGIVSYSDSSGNMTQEYILTAVKGLNGYVLTVDLPESVGGASDLAQTILQSFALTPSTSLATGLRGEPPGAGDVH